MPCRQCHDLHATVDEKRFGTNNKSIRPVLHERSKSGFDLDTGASVEDVNVKPDDASRCFREHVRFPADPVP